MIGEFLKGQLRSEMKRRTEDILKAVSKVEKSQDELTHAIDRWIKFMEKVIEELKE